MDLLKKADPPPPRTGSKRHKAVPETVGAAAPRPADADNIAPDGVSGGARGRAGMERSVNWDAPVGDYTPAGEAQRADAIRQHESAVLGLHLDVDPTLRRPTTPAPDAPDPEPERARIEEELGIFELSSNLAEYGTPPVAPPAERADRDLLERELLRAALADIPRWNVSARRSARSKVPRQVSLQAQALDGRLAAERRQLQQELDARWSELNALRDRAAYAVDQWVSEEMARREAARVERQVALDSEWQALIDADPDTVTDALRAALSDPTTTVLGALDHIAVLVVACPDTDDLIAHEEPAFTSAGRPTVDARSETRRNYLYLSATASRVLAAVARALSATPAVNAVTCVAVRASRSSDRPWEPIYVGTFQRAYAERLLAEGRWSPEPEALTGALEAAEEIDLELDSRTQEMVALDLSDDPGLKAVMDQLDPAIRSDEHAAHTSDRKAVETFLGDADSERDTDDEKEGDETADLPRGADAPAPLEDSDDSARRAPAEAISERNTPSDTPLLLEALKSGLEALHAVGGRKDPSDPPLVLETLKSDQEAVKNFVSSTGTEAAANNEKRDDDADLQGDSDAAANGPLGGSESTPEESPRELPPDGLASTRDAAGSREGGGDPLSEALKDRDGSVRRAAVEAISRRNDPSDTPLLLEALNDRDDYVRLEAIYALRDRLSPDARRDALITACGDSDEGVRREAFGALAALGDERDTPLLLESLEDSDPGVRLQAIFALRDRLAPNLRDALIRACGDSDANVRRKAFEDLAELGDERDTPLLLKASNDRDEHVRLAATYALRDRLAPDTRRDVLIEACGDSDEDVRRKAFEALAALGDERDTPLLLEALEDSDPGVRLQAIFALRDRLAPNLRDALTGACGDSDANVRRKAFEALAELGDERDTPLLLQALKDSDSAVRLEAIYVLDGRSRPGPSSRLGGPLSKAMKDEDASVRQAAVRLYGRLQQTG